LTGAAPAIDRHVDVTIAVEVGERQPGAPSDGLSHGLSESALAVVHERSTIS
jgi:hypothetical protein